MKPVLIFGAGQVARSFAAYLRSEGRSVDAHLVDKEFLGSAGFGMLVNRVDDAQTLYQPSHYQFLIGMSFQGLNKPRAEKFEEMKALGYEPATFVSGHARIIGPPFEHPKIGAGTFIMDGNCIQNGVEIGENCVLWAGNHIGHDTKIGNHVFIASHAVISGAVTIGDRCFIGVNATIRDGVTISEGCIIGAGASIMSDCEPNGLYPGPRAERSKLPADKLRRI